MITAGEETGCAGAREIVATPGVLGRVGALVVGEPTGLAPRLGHRGVVWIRLHFRGRTAHASMPQEGDNAVLKAARAALALSAHDWGGIAHPVLGRPTLNVGRLEGGLNLNSVPDSGGAGHRHPHGARPEQRRAAGRARAGSTPRPRRSCWPTARRYGATPGGDWLAQVAERAAAMTGGRTALAPVPFATDAGYLTPAYGDPPTVILGPGATEQAHKTDEWCSATADRAGDRALRRAGDGLVPGRHAAAPIAGIAGRHWSGRTPCGILRTVPRKGSTMWKSLLAWLLLTAGTATAAEPAVEVRVLYERFAAAQNAHDLAAVRPLLVELRHAPVGQRRTVVLGGGRGARAHGVVPTGRGLARRTRPRAGRAGGRRSGRGLSPSAIGAGDRPVRPSRTGCASWSACWR